jgi:CheY-like chemotaxis protein
LLSHDRRGTPPVQPPQAPPCIPAADAPGDEADALSEGQLAGLKLLVVDDGQINCEIASSLLAVEGAHCEVAEDGAQALALLRTAAADGTGFDAVFMDVQMPVMDGLQATRHMRADPALAAIPVIALTAGTLPHQRLAAQEAGMDDFISKPIRMDILVATLLRHLRGRVGTDARSRREEAAATQLPPAAAPTVALLPTVPGVNGAQAAHRLQGNRMLFLSMLRSLRDDFADTPQRTRADLALGNVAAAAARLHRLRGLAGNVSADTVAAFAGQLEEALREGMGPLATEPALAGLGMALQELLAGLPAEVDRPYGAVAAVAVGADAAPALLRELLQALAAGDMEALAQYRALRPTLATRHGLAALNELDHAMDLLRFQQVSTVLRGWYPDA